MKKSTRIKVLLALDIVFFVVEIVVGYAVHSLALVADSFHMVSDWCAATWFHHRTDPVAAQRHYLLGNRPMGCARG